MGIRGCPHCPAQLKVDWNSVWWRFADEVSAPSGACRPLFTLKKFTSWPHLLTCGFPGTFGVEEGKLKLWIIFFVNFDHSMHTIYLSFTMKKSCPLCPRQCVRQRVCLRCCYVCATAAHVGFCFRREWPVGWKWLVHRSFWGNLTVLELVSLQFTTNAFFSLSTFFRTRRYFSSSVSSG